MFFDVEENCSSFYFKDHIQKSIYVKIVTFENIRIGEIKRHALRERVAGTSMEYNCFSNDLFVTDISCIKNSKLRFCKFY